MITVELIFMLIVCILTDGISADDNLLCRSIDFNRTNSVSDFEECTPIGSTGLFTIKSYFDDPLPPLGDDYEYYLSNVQPGWACFSLIELFALDVNTEFFTTIYLQSSVIDDASYVEIRFIDLDLESSVFPLINAPVTSPADCQWCDYSQRFGRSVANAKIEIRASVSPEAQLAIQHFRISNSAVEESECERTIETTTEETITEETTTEEEDTTTTEEETIITEETTTEEITTEESTTEGTITEETTTEVITTEEITDTTSSSTTTLVPPESNDRNVWMITSFVFFLTTIIALTGSIYLTYLYKTTLAMKSTLLGATSAQYAQTSLPRLTVATSSQGHQVIVGIENVKQF